MAASKRRGSLRGGGFDAMASPVPGNVFACMEELGIEDMRQKEDEIEGKCPMHFERIGKEDKHSSWSVQADEGYFNCFSCGYKGPFVLLVKDLLKIDWSEAVQWIRARGSIERARRLLGGGEYIEDIVKSGPIDTSKQYNEASLALFTDVPVEVCEERNLDPASVDFYGIRWNPEKELWITPIRDPDTGKLWGWQEKNARYFRNRPRDVKKSHTLFGMEQFEEGSTAIVIESPLDVPRLHTVGVEGGLGSYGAAISDEQIDLLLGVTDDVIWALDNDTSGAKACEAIRRHRSLKRIRNRFFYYNHVPDLKDPGEMTEREIERGIAEAYSSVLARF